MSDKREIDVSDIFEGFYFLLLLLVTIEDPSLSAYGYQVLPLATSYLVGNNREFDASGIF